MFATKIVVLAFLLLENCSIEAQVLFPNVPNENSVINKTLDSEDIAEVLFNDSASNEISSENFGEPTISRYFDVSRINL